MKPKEFDDLVRQKFEQNDFEYNPGNWERLESELDGRSKKRSMFLGWWMPLIGIAASVTLAMGVSFLMHDGIGGPATAHSHGAQKKAVKYAYQDNHSMVVTSDVVPSVIVPDNRKVHESVVYNKKAKKNEGVNNKNAAKYEFSIKLQNALNNETKHAATPFDFMSADEAMGTKQADKKTEQKKELVASKNAIKTFKEDVAQAKPTKVSLILTGGVNHGAVSNGYMAGATVRKMITNNFFIESDVAFASSSNSQSSVVSVTNNGATARTASGRLAARSASRSTFDTGKVLGLSGKVSDNNTTATNTTSLVAEDQTYSANYIQVTPSLGYKVMKNLSLGLGPDFQQMLTDNRPAVSSSDRGNIQEAPLFDIGLMGKTEYSLTKNIKAGVSYRKGVNNFITPTATDRYIDRDYLMVQLKFAIFNK